MKFILVVLVVLFGVWVWRRNRREEQEERDRARAARKPPAAAGAPPAEAIEMVRCLHCGVHCPRTDAVGGRLGGYCSAQHRALAEP